MVSEVTDSKSKCNVHLKCFLASATNSGINLGPKLTLLKILALRESESNKIMTLSFVEPDSRVVKTNSS